MSNDLSTAGTEEAQRCLHRGEHVSSTLVDRVLCEALDLKKDRDAQSQRIENYKVRCHRISDAAERLFDDYFGNSYFDREGEQSSPLCPPLCPPHELWVDLGAAIKEVSRVGELRKSAVVVEPKKYICDDESLVGSMLKLMKELGLVLGTTSTLELANAIEGKITEAQAVVDAAVAVRESCQASRNGCCKGCRAKGSPWVSVCRAVAVLQGESEKQEAPCEKK